MDHDRGKGTEGFQVGWSVIILAAALVIWVLASAGSIPSIN